MKTQLAFVGSRSRDFFQTAARFTRAMPTATRAFALPLAACLCMLLGLTACTRTETRPAPPAEASHDHLADLRKHFEESGVNLQREDYEAAAAWRRGARSLMTATKCRRVSTLTAQSCASTASKLRLFPTGSYFPSSRATRPSRIAAWPH